MQHQPPLTFGMIGGGRDAFIGAVHRTAACLDHQSRFVAGALSSTPERALASARDLGLPADRSYPTWQAMLETELKRPVAGPGEPRGPQHRIDYVVIATPNDAHFAPALAFTRAGIHVVCDKPLCMDSQQAAQLVAATDAARTVFAVTYTYSGYPLVKHARHMVAGGELGAIRKVIVEYNQGWLATQLEGPAGAPGGQKQATWRTDPARSGIAGAMGDIGSHAEHLIRTITGLEPDAICADLTTFVPGRRLDDDANMLLRFRPVAGGVAARGVLIASQVEIGHENDLRIRVFGERGSLEWHQEDPNALVHRPADQPERVLRRGNGYLCDAAKTATRTPPGHPEGYFEAFANIYRAAIAAMRARNSGTAATPDAAKFDYPSVRDGARGIRFIEKTVESSRSDRKWTTVD